MTPRIAALLVTLGLALAAQAQTTTFTYQGSLTENGAAVTGAQDFEFRLFGAVTGGAQIGSVLTLDDVGVTNGLFTVALDFGAAFDGAPRFLSLSVRPGASTGSYTNLTPRQPITTTPYALRALSADSAGSATTVTTVAAGAVNNLALASDAVDGAKILNGSITSADLNASLLNGLFWNLDGNAGTTPGTHFLGTTDSQPLELKVNGQRVLRLEPTASIDMVNLVGGSARNFVAAGVVGATIGGGGGSLDFDGMTYTNSVAADFGTVGGGTANAIANSASNSVIAGGFLNDIGVDSAYGAISGGNDNNIAGAVGFVFGSPYSSIGGGQRNNIGTESPYSVIAGGQDNDIGTANGVSTSHSAIGGGNNNNIGGSSTYSTIAGGQQNNIGINSDYSTIGGGTFNRVSASSQYATIPGGDNNFATNRAFAAGTLAKANHSGAFVWGDSFNGVVASSANNQFTVRASGGARFFSNTGQSAGVSLAAGGTAWAIISDRNVKKNFQPVNRREVLEKLAALPVTRWNYQWEADDGVPHIGPMAQDFKAAFYPGRDDKSITTQEADGVALAAIQGLNEKVEQDTQQKAEEIAELKQQNAALLRRLAAIEARLK